MTVIKIREEQQHKHERPTQLRELLVYSSKPFCSHKVCCFTINSLFPCIFVLWKKLALLVFCAHLACCEFVMMMKLKKHAAGPLVMALLLDGRDDRYFT